MAILRSASLKGIKGKLFLAFGAVAAITLVVGVVGWMSLAMVGSQFSGVTQRNVPHVVATLELTTNSSAAAAAAPGLFSASNESEHQQRAQNLDRLRRAMADNLAAIGRFDAQEVQELRPLVDRTNEQLAALDKVVVQRLKLAERHTALVDKLDAQTEAFGKVANPALAQAKNTVAAASMSIGGDAAQLTKLLLRLVGTQVPAQQRLSDLVNDINIASNILRTAVRAPDDKVVDALASRFAEAADRVDESLDVLQRINKVEGLRAAAEAVMGHGSGADSAFALRHEEIAALTAGNATLADTRATVDKLNAAVERVVEDVRQRTATASQDSDKAINTGIVLMLVLAALSLVAAAAIGWFYVGGRIAGRLHGLSDAMTALSQGNLQADIDEGRSGDEIGEMAQALRVFRDGMTRADKLAGEQRTEQQRKETRQRQMDEAARDFDSAISNVASAVGNAATGLKQSAETLSHTARETSEQVTNVAAASEEASTNVQTVAAAAEELAASIAEIGRQVSESAKVAARAVDDAQHTNSQVRGLADAAQKIGDVVKLINDIAGQTNLLALNATIEAARAGDAGKGFAVVASEVKSLATQTAKATEDIAAQVSAIQAATSSAVTAIGNISSTIGHINEISTSIASAVEQQGAATKEISRNVQEAARGTTDVSSNITNVSKSAERTGSAAAEVLGATEDLSKQSQTLRQVVDTFIAKMRAA
ncbi:MAG: HAMP domain-containing protein [Alphaproteobacteria bacterium]|nr:HAMP domain-containing protein [Alphaproteobacteria bacterium]